MRSTVAEELSRGRLVDVGEAFVRAAWAWTAVYVELGPATYGATTAPNGMQPRQHAAAPPPVHGVLCHAGMLAPVGSDDVVADVTTASAAFESTHRGARGARGLLGDGRPLLAYRCATRSPVPPPPAVRLRQYEVILPYTARARE